MKIEDAIKYVKEVTEMSLPWDDKHYEALQMAIKALKEPEPRTGEWQSHYDALTGNMEVRCSFCNARSSIDPNLLMDGRTRVELFRYCPNCGSYNGGDAE